MQVNKAATNHAATSGTLAVAGGKAVKYVIKSYGLDNTNDFLKASGAIKNEKN